MHVTERAWHAAFCRWFDHDAAGHGVRAALWGRVADSLAWLVR